MSFHLIVGAGPVGSATAERLAKAGERVRIVTRRGSGPEHPAIERIAADASDGEHLGRLAEGAVAIYNCANPQYTRWLTDWPPLATALLAAAEKSGAVLTVANNLYGHGPVSGPIGQETPLAAEHPKLKIRADMFRDALALHQAGRIRMTEVRASDYIEANSIFTFVLAKALLAGKRAFVPSPLDVPHTWTSIRDVAATLTTVSTDERAWGKAWPVPSHPPLTVREIAARFVRVAGAPPAKVSSIPYPVLWAAGLFDPLLRELRTTYYQFARPFVLDSSVTEETFGLKPGDLDLALEAAANA